MSNATDHSADPKTIIYHEPKPWPFYFVVIRADGQPICKPFKTRAEAHAGMSLIGADASGCFVIPTRTATTRKERLQNSAATLLGQVLAWLLVLSLICFLLASSWWLVSVT